MSLWSVQHCGPGLKPTSCGPAPYFKTSLIRRSTAWVMSKLSGPFDSPTLWACPIHAKLQKKNWIKDLQDLWCPNFVGLWTVQHCGPAPYFKTSLIEDLQHVWCPNFVGLWPDTSKHVWLKIYSMCDVQTLWDFRQSNIVGLPDTSKQVWLEELQHEWYPNFWAFGQSNIVGLPDSSKLVR